MTPRFLYILLFSFFFIACSDYNKILKSNDLRLKYDKAVEYYEKKQYFKAYPLLEELSVIYRGTSKAEQIDYYLAYCDYYTGDLLYAAYRFKRFAQTYPKSKYAEECSFMSAYCYYRNSPQYSLDQ
ncbi:MAG: outer membrane protein assembly factor BamD, partial [Bacteroidetes bacterium]